MSSLFFFFFAFKPILRIGLAFFEEPNEAVIERGQKDLKVVEKALPKGEVNWCEESDPEELGEPVEIQLSQFLLFRNPGLLIPTHHLIISFDCP